MADMIVQWTITDMTLDQVLAKKADTDLSNLTPIGLARLSSGVAPDWARSISINYPYTFTKPGIYQHTGGTALGNVYMNGYLIDSCVWYPGQWTSIYSIAIAVDVGDIVTVSGNPPSTRRYIPYKGS